MQYSEGKVEIITACVIINFKSDHEISQNFAINKKPLWSCAWQPDFLQKLFMLQKWRKWAKNSFFVNLRRKLVFNFHWTCSVMKMSIICCVPMFGKFTLSQEWTDGINWYFACWYKFMQIKRWLKILGTRMAKNGCD